MKTYEEEMRKRLEDGRGPRRIDVKDVFPTFETNKNTPSPAVSKPSSFAVSGPPSNMMPAVLYGKDLTPNYTQRMWDDTEDGKYASAMYNEMMHNEKNGYLGLGYENSHIFNYDDPYRGDLDRQREAIENRDPFSYDYREDDLYKSILRLKEKEAEKAYNDGYAQLSRQFDGDIPVNMINKLLTTKGEIIDQADSYIPTLVQLAREMHENDYNKALTDYNITRDLAADDYQKFLTDRNFYVSGKENAYAREKDLANRIAAENAAYMESLDKNASRQNEATDTIVKIAENLVKEGKFSNMKDAIESLMFIKDYYN